MDLAHFLQFTAAVLVMELTPGPNMGWLAALTAGAGRGAGLAATAGIAIGLALNAGLAAMGLAALVAAEPGWAHGLRMAGVAMMLGLALAVWRARDLPAGAAQPGFRAAGGHFMAGLAINIVNPKAVLFFVAVVPPFLHGAPLTWGLAAGLAAVSVGIATAVHLAIVAGASRARERLGQTVQMRRVRRGMALAMVALAMWMATQA